MTAYKRHGGAGRSDKASHPGIIVCIFFFYPKPYESIPQSKI